MSDTVGSADNGRASDGTFTAGNRFAAGNPIHRQVAELRRALLAAVTPARLERIVEALLVKAEGGDTVAARELLDRVLGRPSPSELLERIEALERALAERIDA